MSQVRTWTDRVRHGGLPDYAESAITTSADLVSGIREHTPTYASMDEIVANGGFRTTLGEQMASHVSSYHAGASTTGGSGDVLIKSSLVMRALFDDDGTHVVSNGYKAGMSLFSAKNESYAHAQGAQTVMSLPVLNEALDQRTVQQALNADATPFTQLLADAVKSGSASRLLDAWAHVGVMTLYEPADAVGYADQRLVSYAIAGECETYNVFGTDLKDGDHLYYEVRKVVRTDRVNHRERPDGAKHVLQVVGRASRESACAARFTKTSKGGFFGPPSADVEIVGYIPVGTVRSAASTTMPSQAKIDAAHRSQAVLGSLPTVSFVVYDRVASA